MIIDRRFVMAAQTHPSERTKSDRKTRVEIKLKDWSVVRTRSPPPPSPRVEIKRAFVCNSIIRSAYPPSSRLWQEVARTERDSSIFRGQNNVSESCRRFSCFACRALDRSPPTTPRARDRCSLSQASFGLLSKDRRIGLRQAGTDLQLTPAIMDPAVKETLISSIFIPRYPSTFYPILPDLRKSAFALLSYLQLIKSEN